MIPVLTRQIQLSLTTKSPGGWTYQFTKDGSVIWQQKPVASEAASSSPAASAKNAGEPVLFGNIAAAAPPASAAPTAPTSTYVAPEHLVPSSIPFTADDSVSYASHHGIASTALNALSHDLSSLTVTGNSENQSSASAQAFAFADAAVETGSAQQASNKDYSSTHCPRDTLLHGQEASTAAPGAKKGGRQHHAARQKEGKARHAAHTRSQKAGRRPKSLGEVIGKERGKRFDSVAIVDEWQWG